MPKKRRKIDWQNLRDQLYLTIFRSSTQKGKIFDIALLIAILLSILVVLLDSVPAIHESYGTLFAILEWTFTILFTIEYIVRIWVLERKWKYITGPWGVIDLLAILPTYLGIFFVGYQYLIVLRSLRILRVFKIFNLWHYIEESQIILKTLYNSYRKIMMFMLFLSIISIIIGSLLFIVEKDTPGFESIPNSIYWAIVTITTVGYGDVVPVTSVGKFIATIVMLCGYSIIAVPTGIVSLEMTKTVKEAIAEKKKADRICNRCGAHEHAEDARYCRVCGEKMDFHRQ